MSNTDDQKNEIQEFKLEIDQELRFEVESKTAKVYVSLRSGQAEVFGTEIVKGKLYEFTAGAKVAVFTWFGCTLEIRGQTDVIYVAKETPMVIYSNCHAALENMRIEAEKENTKGPVTMVVGPCDVGKSTLCRILLNYAVREGRRPIFVDLDVGQGSIGVPGSIGALLIERPASIDEGFAQEAPLVFNYGHKSLDKNIALLSILTSQLASAVKEKLEVNKRAKSSGVVINTCGWVKNEGYKMILNNAKVFEVDVVLVLDQERLYNELVRDMPDFVKVIFLQKSGGVVERSKSVRADSRNQRICEYFYGSPKNALYPHSFEIKWSELKIFRIGAPPLPDSCLPLGMKPKDHMTKLVPLTPNAGLLHHLLAVSFCDWEEDDIIKTQVAGFVCVTNVDTDRQTITLLSPQPKPLPNNVLVLSELQFIDSH